jgi:hypothetical protein
MEEGNFIGDESLSKSQSITLIVAPNQTRQVLNLVGNDIDKKGFIINKNTKERIYTLEYEDLEVKKLGAIVPGSKIFLKKNIASFSQYLVNRNRKEGEK